MSIYINIIYNRVSKLEDTQLSPDDNNNNKQDTPPKHHDVWQKAKWWTVEHPVYVY